VNAGARVQAASRPPLKQLPRVRSAYTAPQHPCRGEEVPGGRTRVPARCGGAEVGRVCIGARARHCSGAACGDWGRRLRAGRCVRGCGAAAGLGRAVSAGGARRGALARGWLPCRECGRSCGRRLPARCAARMRPRRGRARVRRGRGCGRGSTRLGMRPRGARGAIAGRAALRRQLLLQAQQAQRARVQVQALLPPAG